MKKAYISRFISNFIRAIALVLCAIMCMGCFIACSEGSNKNEDGRDKDISSNVDSVHDSWESVLDAFLNAVEKGDSNAISSIIAPLVVDKMRTDPENYSSYEDEFEWSTGVSRSYFDSYDLSSLKIYGKRILSTENIYEELMEMAVDSESDAYAGVEDAVFVTLLIDLEYYGVRIDFDHPECCEDEYCFVKQSGKWYIYEGGSCLLYTIDDINCSHRSGN